MMGPGDFQYTCAFPFSIPGVVEAIQLADVPNSVRQMLIAMLPEAEESFETYGYM